jgi:UDP-glucose 4-epimerase
MRIVVTGGAGFIGSHLVERLVWRGHDLVVLDNLSTGKWDNLRKVINEIDFIEGDIRDEDLVKRLLKGADGVAHLAALTSVSESMEKPALYHEINTSGTLRLLQLSLESNVKNFLFVSSSAVYGHPRRLPIREIDPISPLSVYAATKASAEAYCQAYNKMGLRTCLLRLFNVYGPRQGLSQYSGVITQFTDRVRKGKPPIIFGDGKQTRDFAYVGDVATLMATTVEKFSEGVFNVGTGESSTITKLAKALAHTMGKPDLQPVYEGSRPGEIRYSRADISKARKVFGFRPEVSLEVGLRLTIR